MAIQQPYPDKSGFLGARSLGDEASDLTAHSFLISQVLAKIPGATLVLVRNVTNSGGVAPVGFVDVTPMVNQIDGGGNATPHGVVYGLPYVRIQGGANAIILDPQAGDIGVAIFASRDLSAVKRTRQISNPGSRRRGSMSDGIYIGGCLNGTPSQYVAFSASGITLVSPTEVTITAPTTTVNGDLLVVGGNAAVTGAVIAGAGGADQVGLQTHRHGGGSAPTPGT